MRYLDTLDFLERHAGSEHYSRLALLRPTRSTAGLTAYQRFHQWSRKYAGLMRGLAESRSEGAVRRLLSERLGFKGSLG